MAAPARHCEQEYVWNSIPLETTGRPSHGSRSASAQVHPLTLCGGQGIGSWQEPDCLLPPPSTGQSCNESAHRRLVHRRQSVCLELPEGVHCIIHPPQLRICL